MRRKATTLLALVTIIAISSCSGDSTRPAQKTLPGRWELVEGYTLSNNGTGPAQWHPYKNGLVIHIHPDSSYTASGQLSKELTPYTYDGKFYGYSPLDSSITNRYRLGDQHVKLSITDDGQTLILMGFCSTGCGHKFKRVP